MSSTASTTLIEASPPGYTFLFSARQGKRGGGIAAIFSDSVKCTERNLGDFSTFEYLAMTITSKQSVLALTIYRPPKHNPDFLYEFSELLSVALVNHDRVILLGDFNFHINVCSDNRAMEFIDLVSSLDFTQHVRNATHIHGNTLDLIFSRNIDVDVSSTLQVPVSDHFCVFFKISLPTPNKDLQPDTITYRRLDTTAKSILVERLHDLLHSWTANCDSLNQLTDNLNRTLLTTLDTVAPLKTRKRTRIKSAPWFSDDTRSLKQTCRKHERKWRVTKQKSDALPGL